MPTVFKEGPQVAGFAVALLPGACFSIACTPAVGRSPGYNPSTRIA